MKKLALMLFVLLFMLPFASSANRAEAQVVVRVGPRYHRRPYYRHRYYHRRYYHHPYDRY